MQSIIYNIDRYQVYRGFLLVEGWAFAKDTHNEVDVVAISLSYELKGVLTRSKRQDVLIQHVAAPIQCGFALRVIIPENIDFTTLKLSIKNENMSILLERPWEQLFSNAYAPLLDINNKFFDLIKTSPGAKVLEIGARARSGVTRKEMFGDNVTYTGLDIKTGENVDFVGDAHLLSDYFASCSFDFAYSVSVFEHLMWPWKVAIELGKVMKLGGLILMQSHPVWPKHEVPWDFFRFWDSGWRALFCRETGFEVIQTVEVHPVDLVAVPFTGSYVHHFENLEATLASCVLAKKVGEPSVEWLAAPRFENLGIYPG